MSSELRDSQHSSGGAKFTVEEAVRAFRAARGGATKPALVEGVEDRLLKPSGKGGFLLTEPIREAAGGSASPGKRSGKKSARGNGEPG